MLQSLEQACSNAPTRYIRRAIPLKRPAFRWPDEAAFLQPFGVERHAETVMPKDLDQVTSGASKDVKITCVGIAPQRFLDLQRQAIHAAPHIGSPDRKPNAHA